MYRLIIVPVDNGWIIELTYEGHIELKRVFSDEKGILLFLKEELPSMKKGFINTLKRWVKK